MSIANAVKHKAKGRCVQEEATKQAELLSIDVLLSSFGIDSGASTKSQY